MKFNNKLIYASLILFCFLFPLVESSEEINYKDLIKSNNINYQLNNTEKPDWGIGDSWIYSSEINLNIIEEGVEISVYLSLNNLNLIVEEIIDDNFIINLNSNVYGDFLFDVEGMPKISGNIRQTELSGQMTIDKNNYGFGEIAINILGKLKINLLPINLNIEINLDFNPYYTTIDFPIYVGKTWETNWTDVTIEGSIDLPGIADLFPSIPDNIIIDNDGQIGGNNLICETIENVSISSGDFEVYNISVDNSKNLYYSPVAGNIIKLSPVIIDNSNYEVSFTFEMISTTYTMPGAPNKPEKPSGPKNGKINTEYNYSTHTEDLEGDNIFYLFDWGDGSNSGWIGPFESGETATSIHIWTEKGSYNIKVKAKDTNNLESLWSESLHFSTPKIHVNLYDIILNFINKIQN